MSEMLDGPHDALDPDADELREKCGVFGIFGHPDAAAVTALGLHAPVSYTHLTLPTIYSV